MVAAEFNCKWMKPLIPELYKELHDNTALGAIFDAYAPKGVDVSKFGRMATAFYNQQPTFAAKVPVMYGRNITIEDTLVLKIRVLRNMLKVPATMYQAYPQSNPIDEYRIGVCLVDLNIKKCRYIARFTEISRILTDFTQYTPGTDFKQYLLDSVGAFNNQKYVADFLDERKKFYDEFRLIASRF